MLVNFCISSADINGNNLKSIHLPTKFRALAYMCTAEKKLRKWSYTQEDVKGTISEAIELAKSEAEVYNINYRDALSKEELKHYDLVEYVYLVKLPIALERF